MAHFDSCVQYVLRHEGGLSQDKADPGGITNFGISLRFLREVDADTLKRIDFWGSNGTNNTRVNARTSRKTLLF